MKNFVLPKDYPELDFSKMHIYLIENGTPFARRNVRKSSRKAEQYLERLGVTVMLNSLVRDFDNDTVWIGKDKTTEHSYPYWAAGIKVNTIEGLVKTCWDAVTGSW